MIRTRAALLLYLISTGVHAEILFEERFEDNRFAERGWYNFDPEKPRKVTAAEHIPGSGKSLECTFLAGQRGCHDGTPSRVIFGPAGDTVYITFYIKFSENWVGSGRQYHPHLFHVATTADKRYFSPSSSVLNTYIEQVNGRLVFGLQDNRNIDPGCILLGGGRFEGCNGNPATYRFTERRSVAACNGIVGSDLPERTCFKHPEGYWYSARSITTEHVYFSDRPGPYYKNDWHRIEVMLKLNSIENGRGIPDGEVRYWYDGELALALDEVLFRTARYPDMEWDKFMIAPYIGPGSPVNQAFWLDDLTISTHRLHGSREKP